VARRRRREAFPLNADVNVVSLIDVMLLLLVIFMITAPMMQGGVDLTLPKAEAKPLESKGGITVTIDRAGQIRVNDLSLTLPEFKAAFAALSRRKGKEGVYLRADEGVNYGLVVQVLAVINAAGVTQVGMMTQPEEVK
jgi:biopolymer transport protein ExbD/biopolymer transport protein TolR